MRSNFLKDLFSLPKQLIDEFRFMNRYSQRTSGFHFLMGSRTRETQELLNARRLLFGSKKDKMKSNITLDQAYRSTGVGPHSFLWKKRK